MAKYPTRDMPRGQELEADLARGVGDLIGYVPYGDADEQQSVEAEAIRQYYQRRGEVLEVVDPRRESQLNTRPNQPFLHDWERIQDMHREEGRRQRAYISGGTSDELIEEPISARIPYEDEHYDSERLQRIIEETRERRNEVDALGELIEDLEALDLVSRRSREQPVEEAPIPEQPQIRPEHVGPPVEEGRRRRPIMRINGKK